MKISEGRIKVKDIATLQQEKARLKRLCSNMERQMDDRFDHVKEHYGVMVLNTIFPHDRAKNADGHTKGSGVKWLLRLAKAVWKTAKIRSVLSGGVIGTLELIAIRYGLKFFTKYFGKGAGKR